MKKLFISADIEGTCGITHWDETEKGKADYEYFAQQMTKEVEAACLGAIDSGYEQILVKDAHDSARNIDPRVLPQAAQIIRGWAGNLYSMMAGIDKSFDGVVFTGYHAGAGKDSNPLSHTMTTSVYSVTINGEAASELLINCLIAGYVGVPVFAVTGDKGLCDWMKVKSPNTMVVAVNEGMGAAVKSIHPEVALQNIREAVRVAVMQPKENCLFALPQKFDVQICYREHTKARRNSHFPGMEVMSERCLRFVHHDFYEVMRMMHFCL